MARELRLTRCGGYAVVNLSVPTAYDSNVYHHVGSIYGRYANGGIAAPGVLRTQAVHAQLPGALRDDVDRSPADAELFTWDGEG